MMASPGSSDNQTPSNPSTVWHPAQEWLEDDELDMDYHPEQDITEDDDDWEDHMDDGSDGDGAGIDVSDENPHVTLGNIHIELATDDQDEQDQRGGHPRIPAARLFELLASSGLQHILQSNGWPGLAEEEEDEDDDEDDYYFSAFRNRPRAGRRTGPVEYPKVPSDEGKELMGEGHFGTDQYYVDRLKQRKKALAMNLMWRELGIDVHGVQKRADQAISQKLIPGSAADRIIHYDARSYSGQFSDDGNFFFCCAQDFRVRMYDTSNPYEWKYYKTVDYPFGRWTITDSTLSPDNRFLVYSSIRSKAYLATTDPEDDSDPSVLDFSAVPGRRRQRQGWGGPDFGIWSLRFSGDGREVVAGTDEDSVIVYDLETKQTVLNLRGRHQHHVNAVCFGDSSSPHILYSGSDDTTLRVWDRRSMGDGREAGVFMGHTEGLTYVDSKGDGRYVLSNGKDQTMKLWDLRKMMTTAKFDTIDPNIYTTDFDYRHGPYPDDCYQPHPHDCSVVTFRGHRVLKTLIRCHFSPPGSTNSRYVYSGSEDGKIYVYNLDATLAGTIDVRSATQNSRPREPDPFSAAYGMSGEMMWRTCVRDVSWHPNAPVLAASSWNGWGGSTGTCTVHSWNDGAADDEGDPPVGRSYDGKLRPIPEFNEYRDNAPTTQSRRPLRSRPVRQLFFVDSEPNSPEW